MYGMERLRACEDLHSSKRAGEIAGGVVESVLDFCGGAVQKGDITLIVVINRCLRSSDSENSGLGGS